MGTMLARNQSGLLNQQGFTLLEIISVTVIIGVLASIAIHRFNLLEDNIERRALESGVRELNIRELLTWTNIKISVGWESDAAVLDAIDTNLGSRYFWDPKPDEKGGTLHFESLFIPLTRTASTKTSAGAWK